MGQHKHAAVSSGIPPPTASAPCFSSTPSVSIKRSEGALYSYVAMLVVVCTRTSLQTDIKMAKK